MIELAAEPGGLLYRRDVAGDSFNTAVYLARAGLAVDYLSCLGDDSLSDEVLAALQEEGIGCSLIRRIPGGQPGLYLIHNDASGERRFSYWRQCSPVRQLFDRPFRLPLPGAFYFTGITLAVCRSGIDNLVDLLDDLRRQGCLLIFDPNYRPALWDDPGQARAYYRRVLSRCHWVLTTLEDDTLLWDIRDVAAGREYYQGLGVDELVIKTPDLTAHAFAGGSFVVQSAPRLPAVDTTGAGDSFNAGYLAVRLRGGELGPAVTAAQSLAANVVQHRGAIIPRETRQAEDD
jgi:2-dehydro-3-deoxygluconokinase